MNITSYDTIACFKSNVYAIQVDDFLDAFASVSHDALQKADCHVSNEQLLQQTDNLAYMPETTEFCQFICQAGWNILKDQGYAMENYSLGVQNLWCQKHSKYSGHDQHLHGFGSQLSGFYFLQTPVDGCRIVLHDPRPAKVYADLLEENMENATDASHLINITPKPGLLVFMNSWLPHGFTRSNSDDPTVFMHFTLIPGLPTRNPNVEIV
jgi:uncharacterized protein (TIGR02466 family)